MGKRVKNARKGLALISVVAATRRKRPTRRRSASRRLLRPL